MRCKSKKIVCTIYAISSLKMHKWYNRCITGVHVIKSERNRYSITFFLHIFNLVHAWAHIRGSLFFKKIINKFEPLQISILKWWYIWWCLAWWCFTFETSFKTRFNHIHTGLEPNLFKYHFSLMHFTSFYQHINILTKNLCNNALERNDTQRDKIGLRPI